MLLRVRVTRVANQVGLSLRGGGGGEVVLMDELFLSVEHSIRQKGNAKPVVTRLQVSARDFGDCSPTHAIYNLTLMFDSQTHHASHIAHHTSHDTCPQGPFARARSRPETPGGAAVHSVPDNGIQVHLVVLLVVFEHKQAAVALLLLLLMLLLLLLLLLLLMLLLLLLLLLLTTASRGSVSDVCLCDCRWYTHVIIPTRCSQCHRLLQRMG
jgi:hypothetical protein